MKKLILAIGLLLLAGYVAAASDAGGQTQIMNEWCRDEPETGKNRLACVSYFWGAVDMSLMMQIDARNNGVVPRFCLFDESNYSPSPDIVRRLWINFIDDNPKYLARPMVVSYMDMLKQEYPCEGDK